MASNFPFGGRVKHFIPFWKTFRRDREVLQILKGVKVEFENNKRPKQQIFPHELKMSEEEMAFVDKEIQHLLDNGFIKKLDKPLPNGWLSNVFLVPKKQSSFRMILNLKPLNKFIKYQKFKMDGIEKVVQMLRAHDKLGFDKCLWALSVYVYLEETILLLHHFATRVFWFPLSVC